jgi:hypothetical protein
VTWRQKALRRANATAAQQMFCVSDRMGPGVTMTKERLIWRPNEISPAAWEALTREEQIHWWKSRRAPAQPKAHMAEAVALYDEGNITEGEFVTRVLQLAAPEEIEGFVRACPPGLLAALRESLTAYGEDEAAWPRTFRMASYCPWVTAGEIEESQRREQQEIWCGVRLLKEYFSRCQPGASADGPSPSS